MGTGGTSDAAARSSGGIWLSSFLVRLVSLQRICFAYELLDYPSVTKRGRKKRLKPVSIILKPVVSALPYIHSLGIIHRDVWGT